MSVNKHLLEDVVETNRQILWVSHSFYFMNISHEFSYNFDSETNRDEKELGHCFYLDKPKQHK